MHGLYLVMVRVSSFERGNWKDFVRVTQFSFVFKITFKYKWFTFRTWSKYFIFLSILNLEIQLYPSNLHRYIVIPIMLSYRHKFYNFGKRQKIYINTYIIIYCMIYILRNPFIFIEIKRKKKHIRKWRKRWNRLSFQSYIHI